MARILADVRIIQVLVTCAFCVQLVCSQASIQNQACETVTSSGISYAACVGQPETLLYLNNTNSQVIVEPENSTCGLETREEYCTLGIPGCFFCDANNASEAHPATNMMDFMTTSQNGVEETTPNRDTYWQSITWLKIHPQTLEINISLAFDHMYSLQTLRFTFESSRPQDAILYKSDDYGETWTVLQYYSQDSCSDYVNSSMPTISLRTPAAVVCTTRYSNRQRYQGGNLDFDIMNDRVSLFAGTDFDNFRNLAEAMDNELYSDLFVDMLHFTSLKLQMLVPAHDTLSQYGLAQAYYAISNIKVDAYCVCNMHAQFCSFNESSDSTVCECQHNTMGMNCEECKPLYNNRPWMPGRNLPYPSGTANECQKCECYDHATSCVYKASLGYGECVDCTHNSTGLRCEECIPGYYHNSSLPMNDPETCTSCNCELQGVLNGATTCVEPSGQCYCKPLVTGQRCDRCVDEYYGLLTVVPAGVCKGCECTRYGTVSMSNVCGQDDGQCLCKENVCGLKCTECCDGFYDFPADSVSRDCLECNCDAGGSENLFCDKTTGQCQCKQNLRGRQCRVADSDFYTPNLDQLQLQPDIGGSCTKDSTMLSDDFPFTGRIFNRCSNGQSVSFTSLDGGTLTQPSVTWGYHLALRYTLEGSDPWAQATLSMTTDGTSTTVNLSKYRPASGSLANNNCPQPSGSVVCQEAILGLESGTGQAWIAPCIANLDARCKYRATLAMGTSGIAGQPDRQIVIDSLVALPNEELSEVYKIADNSTKENYLECIPRIAALSERTEALADPVCASFSTATMNQMAGEAIACDCDLVGTVAVTTCNPYGGQCMCKPGAYGRRCDLCEPGYYNHSDSGCSLCNCDSNGSVSEVCDYDSGQCECAGNVATTGQDNALGLTDDLHCSACLADYYGHYSGTGCTACDCSPLGSNATQCDDFGQCNCKPTIHGDKCDQCMEGYYGYTQSGCSPCECEPAGSTGITCEERTGACYCKKNVIPGGKCDVCKNTSFNLDANNPDGCQECFCYGHGTTCSSAPGYTTEVIEEASISNWALESIDGDLYSTAPDDFLDNIKLSSYGQSLDMRVRAQGAPIDFTDHKFAILEGDGRSVYYNLVNDTATSTASTRKLKFYESDWYYNDTSQPTTMEFYGILADVTDLSLKRRFDGHTLEIDDVSTVTTRLASDGEVEVGLVENCTCVTGGIAGMSCEKCDQGFRRNQTTDAPYSHCLPCDCNLRGVTDPPMCDEKTGECLNCRNGTLGFDCSGCANNTICTGTNIECMDFFWGVHVNGCLPCDCDPVGSMIQEMCNKDTGQCVCKNHVTGRQCNECEDNFANLTETGCTECSTCYGLVMDEVNVLREMQANLTSLVEMMESEDTTAELGSFSQRLADTLVKMEQLNTFLKQAEGVNTSSSSQLKEFEATLATLTYTLNTTIDRDLARVASSITQTEEETAEGDTYADEAVNTTRQAYALLNGAMTAYTTQMEALAASLRATDNALTNVSDTTLQDVLRVTQIVGKIDTDSNAAMKDAEQMLGRTQQIQSDHSANTQACTQLENYIATLSSLSGTTLAKSGELMQRATELQTHATATNANASAVGSIDTDIASLSALASRQAIEAASLSARGLQSEASAQATVAMVDAAAAVTASLTQTVSQLMTQSTGLLSRVQTAQNSSEESAASASGIVTAAQNMLDIMQNFDTRSAAVEAEAESHLQEVQTIRDLSQAAIADAANMQAQLLPTKTLANESLVIANLTKQRAAVNDEAISTAKQQAAMLNSDALSSLNDVNAKYTQILNINTTMVTPAQSQLTRATASVQALAAKTASASSLAKNASANVQSTSARIDSLLAKFNSIPNSDPTRAQQLRALVLEARNDFDSRGLKAEVQRLKSALDVSKVAIESMKTRANTLTQQVARLRNIGATLQSNN